MRWIVLLRDPVERALSQYAMERARGDESWPLWAALLFERWRLLGHHDDWSARSPLRHWSYRARGDYARQLRDLHEYFAPGQILLVHNTDLRQDHAGVLARICTFLGITAYADAPAPLVAFEGEPMHVPGLTRALARWCLRKQQREYRHL